MKKYILLILILFTLIITPTYAVSSCGINISKTIVANRSQEVHWKIYANDSLGNLNVTTESSFVVNNSAPTVTASIIPSPTDGSQPLNCSYSYHDLDGDLKNETFFKWYVNDSLLAFTSQNLSNNGNFSNGDNVICSVMVSDGTDNATSWGNSSQLTINDNVNPVLKNDSLSASSGYTNNVINIFVNVTETNAMSWVYLEIENPNQVKSNLTMTQESHVGSEYKYNVSYTPETAGTYSFVFWAEDGSNNLGNLTSTLTYVASVYVAPVNDNGGGGGSGGASYNLSLDVSPKHAEINKFSTSASDSFSVILKNSGSSQAQFKIVPTTGKEMIISIKGAKEPDSSGYYSLESGEQGAFDITFDATHVGTTLIEFQVVDKSGNDVPAAGFDAVIRIQSGASIFGNIAKNLYYPLTLDSNAEKVSISSSGIVIPAQENVSIPIGWLLAIVLTSILMVGLQKSLFLKKKVLKNNKNLDLITFSIAAAMVVVIFMAV